MGEGRSKAGQRGNKPDGLTRVTAGEPGAGHQRSAERRADRSFPKIPTNNLNQEILGSLSESRVHAE